MTTNNNRTPQVVNQYPTDTESGEVYLPEADLPEPEDLGMEPIGQGVIRYSEPPTLPLKHMADINIQRGTPAEDVFAAAAQITGYTAPTDANIKDFAGQTVTLAGCALVTQPYYRAKEDAGTPFDGMFRKGYDRVVLKLLVADFEKVGKDVHEIERAVYVQSGAIQIKELAERIFIPSFGQGDWPSVCKAKVVITGNRVGLAIVAPNKAKEA